jgi:hypothetical protein
MDNFENQLERQKEDQERKRAEREEYLEMRRQEIESSINFINNNIDRAENQLKDFTENTKTEMNNRINEFQTEIHNLKKNIENIKFEDINKWIEKAESDTNGLKALETIKLDVPQGKNPSLEVEKFLENGGFHKGLFEGTPMEDIFDGSKTGYDNQRFRDVGSELQEHIRYNNPIIEKNKDGSYSVCLDLFVEEHKDEKNNILYGEGIYGDLEPNRRSLEHLISLKYYIFREKFKI